MFGPFGTLQWLGKELVKHPAGHGVIRQRTEASSKILGVGRKAGQMD